MVFEVVAYEDVSSHHPNDGNQTIHIPDKNQTIHIGFKQKESGEPDSYKISSIMTNTSLNSKNRLWYDIRLYLLSITYGRFDGNDLS